MKKLSILLLLSILALSTVFAGSLPGDVISINAIGSYRKMTTESTTTSGSKAESISILKGAGISVSYDSYFNSYVGVYGNLFVAVPAKYTVDGEVITDFNAKDLPVGLDFGCVTRIPLSSSFGLNFRAGFGTVYDKSSTYRYRYYGPYYPYYEATYSKFEYQVNGSLNLYYNFDADGNFGLTFGVNASYTFLTTLLLEDNRGHKEDIADLQRAGYEIMPFIGFTIGSGY